MKPGVKQLLVSQQFFRFGNIVIFHGYVTVIMVSSNPLALVIMVLNGLQTLLHILLFREKVIPEKLLE